LAVELQMRRGIEGSAETMRHWLHDLGWEWKRAKLTAKAEDPKRVEK
jgi:transposase